MAEFSDYHRPAKFEGFSATEMAGDESCRFVDAKNESSRRNCLTRQFLE